MRIYKTICIKKKYFLFIISIIFLFSFSPFLLRTIYSDNIEYTEEDLLLVEKYRQKKLLCLTFDDGPGKYTKSLIDTLQKYNVKATFFVLGENVEKYPEMISLENNAGNLVCIHSYTHKYFTQISKKEILEQVEKTKELINNLTNTTPKYIRVPYGIINSRVKSILKSQELENVLWNIDSLDWKLGNTDKIYSYVISKTTGNDIILMHDIFDTSIEAADKIIEHYINLDYEFVTIDTFYKIKTISKSLN